MSPSYLITTGPKKIGLKKTLLTIKWIRQTLWESLPLLLALVVVFWQ